MLITTDDYSCGVYAIVNACLALGHDHTGEIEQIRKWAGTTKSKGTDEKGILNALKMLEYRAEVITPFVRENGPEVAMGYEHASFWRYCQISVERGMPLVLCVDSEDHWVAVIGWIGSGVTDRAVIFDSQRTAENLEANGVCIYDKREFDQRLGSSLYAIRISDRPAEIDSVGHEVAEGDSIMSSILALVDSGEIEPKFGEDAAPSVGITDEMAEFILRR